MKRLLLVALALTLTAPAVTEAQWSTPYPGTPDPQEYLQFVSGSPGIGGTFGVVVGPYTGRFLTDPTRPQFSLYCVDYDHYARSTWVNTSELGVSNLANTRLVQAGNSTAQSLQTYTQAAYLATLFDSTPRTSHNWSVIHAAMWTTIRGDLAGSPVPGSADAAFLQARSDLMDEAATAVAGGWTADGWYVLTPGQAPPGNWPDHWRFRDGQEFLIRTPVSVPEPSTAILMASGLLALIGMGRRREDDLDA